MKFSLILAAVTTICSAGPVLFQQEEITDGIINNPRYLLYETENGLFEVEDLYNITAQEKVFATEDDVSFYFYTPSNPKTGVKVKTSQLKDVVRLTGFDIKKDTLVIIHGWKNNYESAVNENIRTAALQNNDINVIVTDWSTIAKKIYITAQGSVLEIGNYVGDFLSGLVKEFGYSFQKFTVAGHSLGAHVSGNAGARTGGQIETIVGLDPAGPLFSEKNTNNRLDPTDGRYVHVIHTNTGVLGWSLKLGDADYFPNGGSSQPGCGVDIAGSCAHSRSYIYYAESLNKNDFVSRLCPNYSHYTNNKCNSNTASNMGGYPIKKATTGNYYLTTNSQPPYARG